MAARETLTAIYDDIHAVVGAVRSIREEGCKDVSVFGPIMETELEEAIGKPPSPVRRYALIGGLTGCISGFALTTWSSYYYPLVVGGKALASIPAYVVIAFEMTILFAGILLATLNPLYLTYVIVLLAFLSNLTAFQRAFNAKKAASRKHIS